MTKQEVILMDEPRGSGIEESVEKRMEVFRFIRLSGKQEEGDRFLLPWLHCHVFAANLNSKGERRRASKELNRFFAQKELAAILEEAGESSSSLLEEHLFDSADKYLTICRDDDGFGRKLFGLVRMKAGEKEDRIIADVYRAMIPLLGMLSDLDESRTMIRALDQACRKLYPQRLAEMKAAAGALKDDSLRALLPPFDFVPQESDGSIDER